MIGLFIHILRDGDGFFRLNTDSSLWGSCVSMRFYGSTEPFGSELRAELLAKVRRFRHLLILPPADEVWPLSSDCFVAAIR